MSESNGFKVIDRRGVEAPTEPCRTCGAPGNPNPHTRNYASPTMECIKYLREEISRLKNDLSLSS